MHTCWTLNLLILTEREKADCQTLTFGVSKCHQNSDRVEPRKRFCLEMLDRLITLFGSDC